MTDEDNVIDLAAMRKRIKRTAAAGRTPEKQRAREEKDMASAAKIITSAIRETIKATGMLPSQITVGYFTDSNGDLRFNATLVGEWYDPTRPPAELSVRPKDD